MELEVPARPEFVAVVRLFVASLAAAQGGLDQERVEDLKLAVSEACTNAINSYGGTADGERVRVRWSVSAEGVHVLVEDSGPGFDVEALAAAPACPRGEGIDGLERGLGIPLMRSMVDEVDFSPSRSGTSVRLTMWR